MSHDNANGLTECILAIIAGLCLRKVFLDVKTYLDQFLEVLREIARKL
jgi:hypothetical protein